MKTAWRHVGSSPVVITEAEITLCLFTTPCRAAPPHRRGASAPGPGQRGESVTTRHRPHVRAAVGLLLMCSHHIRRGRRNIWSILTYVLTFVFVK